MTSSVLLYFKALYPPVQEIKSLKTVINIVKKSNLGKHIGLL